MKKLLIYGSLVTLWFITTAAGCGSKAEDPQPDNFQSLLGKWQLQNFAYTITKQNGTTVVDRVDAKARNIVIFYEFFSDGKLVLTQDGQTLQGRWTLN